MKLRRALAILALLAVAILPVAAAPATVTGDVYTGAMWDLGTGYNAYADWNVYVTAQTDDWNKIYINFGRALQTYSAAFNATANSVYENVNNQYVYANLDLAKYFAMDKQLVLQLSGGYYYYGTAAYASKLALAYPRIAYRYTTAPNWVTYIQVGVPALAGLKFAIAPVAFSATGTPYANTNDFIVVPYLNLNLGGGMTANADASYYANKKTDLSKGVITAEGDFTYAAGALKIEAGTGIDVDLTANTFQYMVSARGTFYLDEKAKTTFVQGAAGVRGTVGLVSTVTTYPVDRVEINFQGTFLPLVDILECVSLDLTSTTAPFRSADTCVRFNFGNTDINVGYLYGNNVGAVWGSQNLPNGGVYLRTYFPFN